MTDYKWKGTPEEISGVIYQNDGKTLKNGLQVIGPRTLDGISYVNIRTDQTLTAPEGVTDTGPELSDVIIGVWYDPSSVVNVINNATS